MCVRERERDREREREREREKGRVCLYFFFRTHFNRWFLLYIPSIVLRCSMIRIHYFRFRIIQYFNLFNSYRAELYSFFLTLLSYIRPGPITLSFLLFLFYFIFISGFCDALGLGSSTKAAVIRRGLQETLDYCKLIAGDEFKVRNLASFFISFLFCVFL